MGEHACRGVETEWADFVHGAHDVSLRSAFDDIGSTTGGHTDNGAGVEQEAGAIQI
jgi:hypothetical protein